MLNCCHMHMQGWLDQAPKPFGSCESQREEQSQQKVRWARGCTLEGLLAQQVLDGVKELVRRSVLVDGALVRLARDDSHLQSNNARNHHV